MDFSHQALPQMEHRPSPTLIAFAQILQLDGAEMQQAVRQAIEQNPALELVEREVCMFCGQPLRRGICYACLRRETVAAADDAYRAPVLGDEDYDPLSAVAAPRSLAEVMLEALALSVPREDFFISEYLVGSLDDHAFLPEDILGDVVRSLRVTPERARRALAALQQSGVAGVGARNGHECLLLQLQHLEARGEAHPLARCIVAEHFEALGRGTYGDIAGALGVSVADVIEARDFIRNRLRPFVVAGSAAADNWSGPQEEGHVFPDIVIRANPAGPSEFEVTVAESRRYVVRVSMTYRRLAESLEGGDAEAMSAEDRDHVLEQVARAQQFVGHLRERQSTLRRVAEAVVARQKDYLRAGVRHLVPLTRHQIAAALDLHESTISRAVADKYVLLPWRATVPFSQFFEPARAPQDVLRELIVSERAPQTDDQLAALLAARGYPIARRTVAKYRNRIGLLPSNLR